MKQTLLLIITLQCSLFAIGQTELSGTVSDEYGVLPNVNILNTTTKNGTISNLEGNFVVEAHKNDMLSISHIGYKTIELRVSDFKRQTIVLDIENSLDEVVVTAQSIKKVCRRIVCSWRIGTGCQIEDVGTEVKTSKEIIDSAKLYPNPSNIGIFNLKVKQPFSHLKIEVYSLSGQFILKKNVDVYSHQTTIDLSNFPNGMYIIHYEMDGKKQIPKKAIIG